MSELSFSIPYNPVVVKTVFIMLYLMVGIVIALLRFINDSTVAGIGSAFGWYGGMPPILFYLLYIPLWPLHFVIVLINYWRQK